MVQQAIAVAERRPDDTTKLTLLDRIGGPPAVRLIVDRLIEALTSDPHLAPRFAGLDVARLRRAQTHFLHDAFGGGCAAEPDELALVTVDGGAFVGVVIHLHDALESLGLAEPLVDQLLLAVAAKVLADGAAANRAM